MAFVIIQFNQRLALVVNCDEVEATAIAATQARHGRPVTLDLRPDDAPEEEAADA